MHDAARQALIFLRFLFLLGLGIGVGDETKKCFYDLINVKFWQNVNIFHK